MSCRFAASSNWKVTLRAERRRPAELHLIRVVHWELAMCRKSINTRTNTLTAGCDLPAAFARFHRNEEGMLTFSVAVAVLLFVTLAAFVFNVGQTVRQKIAVQNAADASAQTAAATLARGM